MASNHLAALGLTASKEFSPNLSLIVSRIRQCFATTEESLTANSPQWNISVIRAYERLSSQLRLLPLLPSSLDDALHSLEVAICLQTNNLYDRSTQTHIKLSSQLYQDPVSYGIICPFNQKNVNSTMIRSVYFPFRAGLVIKASQGTLAMSVLGTGPAAIHSKQCC
ncbi:hypothetical protein M422DRAFT_272024 [Sphaerobolus stellatus SS14]|uniref:Uncharacterized protein n=1 Tax=Sphaerobolus stellatus (strain SS14) TaxID=990650 RepID=A0A0C9UNF1_SPHS4|nr:hypothetical protein M422DRAFT_272024 [Sphaerobolus stellatus SS14]